MARSDSQTKNASGISEMIRKTLKTVAILGCFALLWLILVGNAHPQESFVGALSVAATAWFALFARRAQRRRFDYSLRDLLQVRRVPWNVLTDAWRVTGVLLHDLFAGQVASSSYFVLPFKLSQSHAGLDGREVLAVAYATASPNSIVLGVRRGDGKILLHLLEEAPLSSVMTALCMGSRRDT
jgi:hypothetical protein